MDRERIELGAYDSGHVAALVEDRPAAVPLVDRSRNLEGRRIAPQPGGSAHVAEGDVRLAPQDAGERIADHRHRFARLERHAFAERRDLGETPARPDEREVVLRIRGDALGRVLARTVAFFRRVDAIKPSPNEVMKKRGIASHDSVEFIRAYEAAVVATIEKALAEATRR